MNPINMYCIGICIYVQCMYMYIYIYIYNVYTLYTIQYIESRGETGLTVYKSPG